jgi:hypothetical protein
MGAVWASQHLGHIMGKAAADNDKTDAGIENQTRVRSSAV